MLNKSFTIVYVRTHMHTYTYLPFTHDIKSSKEKTATLSACLLNIVTYKFYLPSVPNMINLVIYIFFLPVSGNEFWFQSESLPGGLYKLISTSSFSEALTFIILVSRWIFCFKELAHTVMGYKPKV